MSGPPGESISPLIPDLLDATLVLVRHGESEYIVEGRFQGQAETLLSPAGLRQAALVAERLAHRTTRRRCRCRWDRLREVVHPAAAHHPDGGGDPGRLDAPPTARPSRACSRSARANGKACTATRSPRATPTRWPHGGAADDELGARRRVDVEVQGRLRPALAAMLARLAVGGVPAARPIAGRGLRGRAGHPPVVDRGRARRHLQSAAADALRSAARTVLDVGDGSRRDHGHRVPGGRPVLRAHNLTGHLAASLDEAAQEAQEERSRSGAL